MNKTITALELTANSVTLVQAEQDNSAFKLLACEATAFNTFEESVSALKRLSYKYRIGRSTLVTALPKYQVFVKKITVPPATADEVRNILLYEAERYLPFSADTAVIDFYPLNPLSVTESNEILLIAVKNETIEKYLEVFASAGLTPDIVSVSSLALGGILKQYDNGSGAVALVMIDKSSWEISIWHKGQLIVSRGFAIPQNANNYNVTILSEIKTSISMFYAAGTGATIEKIYVKETGTDYMSACRDSLTVPCVALENVTGKLPISLPRSVSPETLNDQLVPLGLIISSPQHENLLPANVLREKQESRTKNMRLAVSLGILGLACALFFALAVWKYNTSTANREAARIVEANKKEIVELAALESKLGSLEDFKKNNLLPLDILREMSRSLPQSVYIRQFDYTQADNTVLIRGRASSYTVASNAVSSLSRIKYFSQVTNKGSYQVKIGDKELVDFEIVCTLGNGTDK